MYFEVPTLNGKLIKPSEINDSNRDKIVYKSWTEFPPTNMDEIIEHHLKNPEKPFKSKNIINQSN